MCCFSASSSANLESHSLQKNAPFSVQEAPQELTSCSEVHNIILGLISEKKHNNSPQLESEYSDWSSAMSSAKRDLEVLGQTSECCGDWEPQDEQLRRLR